MNYLILFIGGGIGSTCRYFFTTLIKNLIAIDFPLGTLFVNVIGSLIMGMITAMLIDKAITNESIRLLIAVGVLGGFTTFSSFSIETLTLIQRNDLLLAMINILSNVIIGLIASYLGFKLMSA